MTGALPLQLFETELKRANGALVEKWVKSEEGIFRQDTTAQQLPKRPD
jgi:simple sugar transport system substrate-binding protein